MKNLSYVVLALFIITEGTITTLPLVLLFLLLYAVFTKSEYVFLLGFIAGMMLDFLTLRPIGLSSVFFSVILFLILLYERKFEIRTIYFVSLAAFVSSISYLLIFSPQNVFIQSVSSVILSIIFFYLVLRIITPRYKAY